MAGTQGKGKTSLADEAEENGKLSRNYFERGCICIISGSLEKLSPTVPDWDAVAFYHENCTCSRNYDSNLIKLVDLTPMVGEPVFIKTNWKTYNATLEKSPFGDVEFHITNSAHRVQVTTVTGWKYLNTKRAGSAKL